MESIIILFLCLLASSKVTIQGLFAKRQVKTTADGVLFNGMIFFFSALFFAVHAFNSHIPVIIYGAVFGLLTVLFQLCYIKAMSYGNVSLTVLLINLSMIIPVIVSVAVFGEKLSVFRVFGIVLIFITLFLNIDTKDKSKGSPKWLMLSILAAVFNGGLAVCQQLFGKTEYKSFNASFVAYSYIFATAISCVIYLFLFSKGIKASFKIKGKALIYALAVGLILGVFQTLNTKAISEIDGSLLFPVYNGGSLVLSAVSGVILLKDKLKSKQIISIILGIAAIVLINL